MPHRSQKVISSLRWSAQIPPLTAHLTSQAELPIKIQLHRSADLLSGHQWTFVSTFAFSSPKSLTFPSNLSIML